MMRDTKRVSVPLAATVSAMVHAAWGVVCIPALSFLFLTATGSSAHPAGMAATEQGMLFAVLAPILCATLGFAGGAVMAFLFNMFVEEKRRPAIVVEETVPLRRASTVGDAA